MSVSERLAHPSDTGGIFLVHVHLPRVIARLVEYVGEPILWWHTGQMAGNLLILDTATLYYRAFYALPEKMTAPDGHPHNAVRGFLSMLTKLITIHQPAGLVAAWDQDWRPEWRVNLVSSYKTHRVEEALDAELDGVELVPDTLGPQIGAIAQILDACGIARIGFDNFEADDVIASVAAQNQGPNLVVTSDKDMMQVVSPSTSILLQMNGGIEGWPVVTNADVLSRFGVTPSQYLDFAVLRGDPSDGLPGVSGIGDKTGATLIGQFGDLEALIAAAAAPNAAKPLTPRLCAKLLESQDYLARARQVITAEVGLPVNAWDFNIPNSPVDELALATLGQNWGVERFISDLYQAISA